MMTKVIVVEELQEEKEDSTQDMDQDEEQEEELIEDMELVKNQEKELNPNLNRKMKKDIARCARNKDIIHYFFAQNSRNMFQEVTM